MPVAAGAIREAPGRVPFIARGGVRDRKSTAGTSGPHQLMQRRQLEQSFRLLNRA